MKPWKKLPILVVDADVVRSAGSDPGKREGRSCYRVLIAIQNQKFTLVLCDQLRVEWRKHNMSVAALRWQREMETKGRIERLEVDLPEWSERLTSNLPPERRAGAAKDAHLIALAVESKGERVISKEIRSRDAFAAAAQKDVEVGRVLWVSPLREKALEQVEGDSLCDEDSRYKVEPIVDWLEKGARYQEKLSLASRGRVTPRPASRKPERSRRT